MKRLYLLLALITLVGCDALTGNSNIEYRVSGTAVRVSLTYEAESGSSQISSAALPWSFAFRAKRGAFLYVSAQIIQGGGSVTVSIYKGESLYKTATSSGFAAIATASGTLD